MPDESPHLRPQSYNEPGGQAPVEPPRRRGPSMRLVLLLSVPVLIVAVVCAGGLMVYAGKASRAAVAPTYVYTPNPALQSLQASISERDAARERVRTAITDALTAQSAALLAGDRARFVGFADPSAKRTATWLSGRFASLHAMGVAQWTPTVSTFTPHLDPKWQADIEVQYCFVAACSRPLTAVLHTMWTMADPSRPRLVEMWEYQQGRASPPWVRSVLRAKVGRRVVVAASAANAHRLPAALAAAEAAAKVADGYAGPARPGRYVVYLAGAKEWGEWPYDREGKWVAGYAEEKTESVVINLSSLDTTELSVLLRHELGHVASLAGRSKTVKRADAWWLTEGLAEYIGADGKSYFRGPEVASFIRNKWKGDLRVGEPAVKTSVRDASARYGVAYLGVSCLMRQYGRPKTLAFFDAVAVQGSALTAAAPQHLGTSWPAVASVCAAQIRRAAR